MEQLKPKIRNNHDERTFYSSIRLLEAYRYSKLPRGKPHLSCSFKMADGDSRWKWKSKSKRNRLKNLERFLCCLPSYKLNPPMSNGTHEGSLSRRDTVCKSFRGGDTFFFLLRVPRCLAVSSFLPPLRNRNYCEGSTEWESDWKGVVRIRSRIELSERANIAAP